MNQYNKELSLIKEASGSLNHYLGSDPKQEYKQFGNWVAVYYGILLSVNKRGSS